jgi:hypothetical protein
MPDEKQKKVRELMLRGADLVGAGVGGAVGFYASGPVGAGAGGAGGVLLKQMLEQQKVSGPNGSAIRVRPLCYRFPTPFASSSREPISNRQATKWVRQTPQVTACK